VIARLVLIRHGSLGKFDGRYIGRTDPSLSPDGRRQARRLSKMFAEIRRAPVWSSPLRRCRETARLAFPNRRARIQSDLSEMNFGKWEGLTFDEARKRHPQSARRWMKGEARFRFPDGESLPEFFARLRRVRAKIDRVRSRKLIVVAHGGVIRGLLSLYFRMPLARLFFLHIGTGAVLTLNVHASGATFETLSQNSLKRGAL
jgi:broad specificity phosphatase PhoE